MNDEKKKLTILGCLFAGVITIGAMQVMGHKRPPPPPETKKEAVVQPEADKPETKTVKDPQFANELAQRDPFQAPPDETPVASATPKPTDQPAPFPHRAKSRSVKPFDPLPMPGAITPIGGGGPGLGSSAPHYSVVAVIQGNKPMAVVDDGAGNQKLVAVGGSIDGETRLLGVDSSSVSVVSRGKVRRMSIGGNPVGK